MPGLGDALAGWTPLTRVSPLFGVAEGGTANGNGDMFEGRHSLLLLGPVHPVALLPNCSPDIRIWLTLGSFNVVASSTNRRSITALRTRAKDRSVRYELWTIRNGWIEDVETFAPNSAAEASAALQKLSKIAQRPSVPKLQDSVCEYCSLMASTLARSSEFLPELRPLFLVIFTILLEPKCDQDALRGASYNRASSPT